MAFIRMRSCLYHTAKGESMICISSLILQHLPINSDPYNTNVSHQRTSYWRSRVGNLTDFVWRLPGQPMPEGGKPETNNGP